jgi:hypothetical protein
MSKDNVNGHITLSAVDFLKLAEVKRVARVDLDDVGVSGVVYVCGLSTAQQQKMVGDRGSVRIYKDDSRDVAIPKEAAAKMLLECMVTDGQDGKYFEAEFSKTDEEYISVPSDKLVYYRDLWRESMNSKQIQDKVSDLPNVVTNLVMRHVNQLSGLAGDEVEEKKSS